MHSKISKLFLYSALLFSAGAFVVSCDEKKEDGPTQTESALPKVTVPGNYDIYIDEPRVITLSYTGKIEATDVISMEAQGSGLSTPCDITDITNDTFSFDFPEKFGEGGTFLLTYRRGNSQSSSIGTINVRVIEKPFVPTNPATTVYGRIKTDNGPVAGVVVSDGYETTVTNDRGEYELQSAKQLGYVFMSVPSGYEPDRDGVFPQMYALTALPADEAEVVNFKLKPVDQTNYKVLFLGDMHLAKRTNDLNQFAQFTADVNDFVRTHSGEKIYAVTLGDMTWDAYWYNNKFALPDYVNTMNLAIENLMIYHTIGNHDNDFKAVASNYNAKKPFMTNIAPDYYSFNIGQVHYIVMDNIDCSSYDGTTSRIYTEQMMPDQIQWLKKDLSYVDKNTPIVMTMHAPVFGVSGINYKVHTGNANSLFSALEGYKVHFVTGHTHKNYNVVPTHSCVPAGQDFSEHNVAAVCGSWWWSGHLTPGVHLAPDGTPGGYAVWDIRGKEFEYVYKPTGGTTDTQFRAYDLNNVRFTDADVPNLNKGTKAYSSWGNYKQAFPGTKNDYILVNVWNYNPKWKVTVTQEDGTELPVTQVSQYDPLHIAAMTVKRFNDSGVTSAPNFITQRYPHFFRAQAQRPDVNVTIRVEDEFGHVWTETMERPKQFSIEAYK